MLKAEITDRENSLLVKISEVNPKVKIFKMEGSGEVRQIVTQGDTLSHIALRYKKSVKKEVIKKIADDSDIENVDLIYPEEIVIIK